MEDKTGSEIKVEDSDKKVDRLLKTVDKEPPLKKKKVEKKLEPNKIEKYVNLIDIASRLLAKYTGLSKNASVTDLLLANTESLKVIYVIAVGLRSLIGSIISSSETLENGYVKMVENASSHVVHGINLDCLMPGVRRRNTYLTSKCLHLTRDMFEKISSSSQITDEYATTTTNVDDDTEEFPLSNVGEKDGVFVVE